MADPRILVLDAGPAIALDRLGYVPMLRGQDDITLAIAPAVAGELRSKPGAPGYNVPDLAVTVNPDAAAMKAVMDDGRRPRALHAGELETIAVVEGLGKLPSATPGAPGSIPVSAVIDDSVARRFARARGLGASNQLTGTLGLLGLIHVRGINLRSQDGDIEGLRQMGYHLDSRLVEQFKETTWKQVAATQRTQPATTERSEMQSQTPDEGGIEL
jgi:hypothetical protein